MGTYWMVVFYDHETGCNDWLNIYVDDGICEYSVAKQHLEDLEIQIRKLRDEIASKDRAIKELTNALNRIIKNPF